MNKQSAANNIPARNVGQFQPYTVPSKVETETECRSCGLIWCILLLAMHVFKALLVFVDYFSEPFNIFQYLNFLGILGMIYFFAQAAFNPKYLLGKPAKSKFWPQILYASIIVIIILANIIYASDTQDILVALSAISPDFVFLAWSCSAYSQDDESGSSYLCFKPYKVKCNDALPLHNNQQYPQMHQPQNTNNTNKSTFVPA